VKLTPRLLITNFSSLLDTNPLMSLSNTARINNQQQITINEFIIFLFPYFWSKSPVKGMSRSCKDLKCGGNKVFLKKGKRE
jgi:hypothetical protein